MRNHGIFINHRHDNRHLAGRIYDYFQAKGLNPFLDVYSLPQGYFDEELMRQIQCAPYFLCVLTPGALNWTRSDISKDIYYQELELALSLNKPILVVQSQDFTFPDSLPDAISRLKKLNSYTILNDMSNYYHVMDQLCLDIDSKKLENVLDWREHISPNANVIFSSRKTMESTIATLEHRFGKELVQCVKEGKEFEGESIVKEINMACYAANIIFTPKRDMVDKRSYDKGMMFDIFSQLLRDDDFYLTIVTNAPSSSATKDAITCKKLGNNALEGYQQAVFLGTYAAIQDLMQEEIYQKAVGSNRFHFLVSDHMMPFAFFQIIYKPGYESYNHIKIDLYTEGLPASVDRRSLLVFEKDDRDSYTFLEQHFIHLKDVKKFSALIKRWHKTWMNDWKKIEENRHGNHQKSTT